MGRAQASLAAARWDAMLAEHHRLKTEDLPAASLSSAERAGGVDAEAVRRKRLVYRSKQRGWLEVDLLLGTWASACGARRAPPPRPAGLVTSGRAVALARVPLFPLPRFAQRPT